MIAMVAVRCGLSMDPAGITVVRQAIRTADAPAVIPMSARAASLRGVVVQEALVFVERGKIRDGQGVNTRKFWAWLFRRCCGSNTASAMDCSLFVN